MKNLCITFFIMSFSSPLWAQDYTSKDNYIGNWKDSGTWVENTIPSNTGGAANSVHIFGKVTLEDNLLLDNSSASIVTDTLWVRGDLTISNGSSLTVDAGGVLIVDGVLYVNESSFVNNGLTVFTYYELFGGKIANNSPDDFYAVNKRLNYVDYGSYSSQYPIGNYTDFENSHPILAGLLANGTLPIQLLSFTSTVQNEVIHLEWITAWEENFDFFTVERAGSNREFKAIGTVKGKGNTIAEVLYSFIDQKPLKGQAFYRLKATDFDGTFEHHSIISVHFEWLLSTTSAIYPNPVTNHYFKLEAHQNWTREVRLLDPRGKMVYSQITQNSSREILLPEQIKPGIYVLVLLGSQGEEHQQKIIIL